MTSHCAILHSALSADLPGYNTAGRSFLSNLFITGPSPLLPLQPPALSSPTRRSNFHYFVLSYFDMFQAIVALLLQFSLASLVAAAPITAQGNNNVGFGAGGGVVGFIVLILDIICVGELSLHTPYWNVDDMRMFADDHSQSRSSSHPAPSPTRSAGPSLSSCFLSPACSFTTFSRTVPSTTVAEAMRPLVGIRETQNWARRWARQWARQGREEERRERRRELKVT